MKPIELPPDVRRLILGALPTVPHLEALLLLREQPATAWDAGTIAQRLYIDAAQARRILDELGAAGLVAKQADAWHFDVKDAALAGTVAELARLYGRHVVEITRFVHAHADRGVHEFADAFRLRKER